VCTIGFHRGLGVIFKNRDKTSIIAEEIVQDETIIACRSPKTDYFSWGMNVYGCAFVTAAINSPHWTSLIYEGQITNADEVSRQENTGLTNPVITVSSLLPNVRDINVWIDMLMTQPFLSRGYNLLLTDLSQAVVVEAFQDKRNLRRLDDHIALTNHFHGLQHGPQHPADYLSSFRRYEYANNMLASAASLHDVQDMVKPDDSQRQKQIWRSGPFYTISSSVLDFRHGLAYYSRSIDQPYTALAIKKIQTGE
jgi:hypothetical protein